MEIISVFQNEVYKKLEFHPASLKAKNTMQQVYAGWMMKPL